MKNLIVLFMATAFLCSCGEETDTPSQQSTQVLSELANTGASEDVQEYFRTLAQVVDAYVGMIEDMAESSSNADGNNLGDAMSMLGGMASGLAEMAPLLERMEELEEEAEVLKGDMTPEEVHAFMVAYESMMMRFMEASSKMNQ